MDGRSVASEGRASTASRRSRKLPATPSVLSNAARPPWQPPNAGANSVHGADIPPVLDGGRMARHEQNKLQASDKHLLQSLRVHDDPNVEWRKEKIRQKVIKDPPSDRMPSVFEKLTNPAHYTGSHKHRFARTEKGAWHGAGLAGRRDDTSHEVNIAGGGKVLRNIDPEMDKPIRFERGAVMPWELDKLRPDAYHTVDMKRQYRSSEAFDDPIMDPTKGIYGKLSQEQVRANRKETDPGEYEDVQAVRKEYHVDPAEIMPFQVGN